MDVENRNAAGGEPAPAAGWTTVVGTATARQIEESCRIMGVRFDRARRTYWQRERIFPHAAPRRGGRSAGRFHHDAAHLVVVLDECLRRDLPYRPPGARSSLVPLRDLVAAWWQAAMEIGGGGAEAERSFYGRAAREATRLREARLAVLPTTAPATEADPRHHDALSLAVLLEFASEPDHPAKDGAWRMSPDAVRELLCAWPAPSGAGDDDERERELGRWVVRLSAAISAGRNPLRLA